MNNTLIKVAKILPSVSLGLVFFIPFMSQGSDHVDGPITIGHAVADISDLYAFPSPDNPDHLVLILNSYPFVPDTGHFSEQLVYSLMVRPVTISDIGQNSSFNVSSTEYRFDCTFETPQESEQHTISCNTPGNIKIHGKVNQHIDDHSSGIKLFSGRRSDPFLFNADWFGNVVFNRRIPPADSSNNLSSLNVLSIVLELDIKQVFKPQDGPLFAVAGEVSHRGNNNTILNRIDRIGRPEISNARMVPEVQQADLRDSYNQSPIFDMDTVSQQLYLKRIAENIAYYDNLDGNQDWQAQWKETLAKILVNDFLVIDMDKPFSPRGYFDIENCMLRSLPHTRSGGRVPGDHIINTLMTTMLNGGHGAAVTDGINPRGGLPEKNFPYLAPPDDGIFSMIKGYFARQSSSELSLQKRSTP